MKVLFHVFGLPVHLFGVMIAAGLFAGIYAAHKEIKRKGLDTEKFFDIVLYSIVSAVVGARLFFILFYDPMYYIKNPIDIFKIYEGGLSIHGGLLGAFLFGFLYIRKHKLDFFQYADAIAPGIILGQGIGRIGCDVFGRPVSLSLPWAVNYGGQMLHPAQVYEFILDYLVFFILLRKRKKIKYNGQLFILYVILFSINRSIVELFRTNPHIAGWFSVSHLLSVVFIIGAVLLMYLIKRGTFGTSDIAAPMESDTVGKSDLLKDSVIVMALTIISMIIFYTVW
jgi:phosphatidylglycerol:prolipoprotein diacylglycerol transferase